MRMRRGFRAIAAGCIAVTAMSACVDQKDTGVGLVKFDSSTIFGASKPTELPGFDIPPNFNDLLSPVLPRANPLVPTPDPGPCPDALLTAFPKAVATVKVNGTPATGVYKWKRVALQLKDVAKKPPVEELPFALESRAIRRVVRNNDHEFTFEMLAPDPLGTGNTVITTYLVNTNPKLLIDQTVNGRTIGVVPIPTLDLRYGTPGDSGGIFISRIETQNEKGGRVSLFAPISPVLVLPLDGGIIRGGQTFQGLGIDPTSQTILLNQGTVLTPNRVDACGDIVEGFAVQLTQTFTSDIPRNDLVGGVNRLVGNRKTRDVVLVFATQFGALPIRELVTIGQPMSDPMSLVGQWELGSQTPAPLPDSLK